MNESLMNAKDAVSGSLAECYITIDGERYNFMQLISFEAKWTANISEVPILGRVNKGHKATGGSGEWSGTAHYNQSVLRKLMKKYQDTGVMQYFEIQVTNEDPTTTIGRQTVILRDCLADSTILAKFDASSSDYLDEDLSGTFESWEMPEEFTTLDGMI